jgi:hypothetical protein
MLTENKKKAIKTGIELFRGGKMNDDEVLTLIEAVTECAGCNYPRVYEPISRTEPLYYEYSEESSPSADKWYYKATNTSNASD